MPHKKLTGLLLVKALALTAGCSLGCDDYFCIDGDDVRALPAGNATGKIVWHTELVATTTQCAEQCVYPGYPPVVMCSMSRRTDLGSIRFSADEGLLVVDDMAGPGGLFVQLRGGLNKDGSFDAGSVEHTKAPGPDIMRMRGRIGSHAAAVSAVLERRDTGMITPNQEWDCLTRSAVTGTLVTPP